MQAPKTGEEIAAAIETLTAALKESNCRISIYVHSTSDGDPSLDWCEATTEKGLRCPMDAAKDGLCKTHWRQRERKRPQPQKNPYGDYPDED